MTTTRTTQTTTRTKRPVRTAVRLGSAILAVTAGGAALAAGPAQAQDRLAWQPSEVTSLQCRMPAVGQYAVSWTAPAIQGATPVQLYQYAISADGGRTYGQWQSTKTKGFIFTGSPDNRLGYRVMVLAQNGSGIGPGAVAVCPGVAQVVAPGALAAVPQGW